MLAGFFIIALLANAYTTVAAPTLQSSRNDGVDIAQQHAQPVEAQNLPKVKIPNRKPGGVVSSAKPLDMAASIGETDISCCTEAINTGKPTNGCDINKCLEAFSGMRSQKRATKPFLESELIREAERAVLKGTRV
ncbi:hypothetical protein H072_2732 [Dactylellina haptotyla CBS 200.50]|uniref:Uncharacterized protein n=1 Tax=Dactylellina haptotyla (strain CBS 200.50) TaxID=1284197 RepID=S8C6A1_DACHA|nr:hypothetical protein H072_2732 [Dactylellina haptotyla CBS 200.50]